MLHSATSPPAELNVSSYLARHARERGSQTAVVLLDGGAQRSAGCKSCTFAELDALSNCYANGLTTIGMGRGTRVLVMVRPGLEFFGVIFALFKLGAVPVMIDPGMGVGRMMECIRGLDLQGFIGVPLAHVLRLIRGRDAFAGVTSLVTVGRRWFWGGASLRRLADAASDKPVMTGTTGADPAAILFTSGSTGPAKGVAYEHGMFDAQIRMIQAQYGMQPGEVDVPTFPLFALFSLAMGLTAVIPEMDASRPARANPAKIVRAIQDHAATTTFGSPALWRNVADYCAAKGIKLPTLRRVLIAGAPVSPALIRTLHGALTPQADVYTPYGATEALPVASVSGREVLAARETAAPDAGTCVGKPVAGTEVRILRISDEPIERWSDDLVSPDGAIGEIVVRGPVVTLEYAALPSATRLAKIADGATLWHRMGDVGYFDGEGRLWYCGRKSHRVVTVGRTFFTDCIEGVLNEHPEVARSALVGVGPPGKQQLVYVVQPSRGRLRRFGRNDEIRERIHRFGQERGVIGSNGTILFHHSLPVDVRHNAKINREALAQWAATRV